MSAARTARRRRRQAAIGYRNEAPLRRPHYKHAHLGSIADSIARERARAARMAAASKKKKG